MKSAKTFKLAILGVSFFFIGCSSFGGKKNEWAGKLTPQREQLEVTRYQYQSTDQYFNEDGLLRERTESADFVVLTRYVDYTPEKDQWQIAMMTSQKDGPVELYDLGFPEKNERIDYVWDSRGRVYKAGNRDPQSLFFIPSFPYPQQPMRLGQSWTYEHDWITKKGLPMKMKVTSTLKEKTTCFGAKESCWLIDIKGEVVPPEALVKQKFKSTFIGQCWIDEKSGLVTQSWTSSHEGIETGKDRVEVNSCLASQSRDGQFPTCPSNKPK